VGKSDLDVAPRQSASSSVAPHPHLSGKTLDIRCDPVDFFLFPKLKATLKGRRFQTTEEIQENAIRELRAIIESAIQEALQQWKKRLERYIVSRAVTLKGDSA
jgi:hypothetical protein